MDVKLTKEPDFQLDEIHRSLRDPALDSINFLNEVIDQYPQAISFAPGAPFASLFDDLNVANYIERFEGYLAQEKFLSARQIKKLLFQYGPSKGVINDLIAKSLQIDENITTSAESVVMTVGCQEAIVLALRALFTSKSDILAVINPSFAGIMGAASILDIDKVPVNELGHSIDWRGLAHHCELAKQQGKKVKALYVAPDYSNPSGKVLSFQDRKKLLEYAQQYDFVILEDNAYGFTAESVVRMPTLKSLDVNRKVIYLGTCAKTCMPGIRIGFAVADQTVATKTGELSLLADVMATIKSMITVNTPPVCQAIVAGMLLENGGSLNQISDDKARLYRSNLTCLLDELDKELGPEKEALKIDWNVPDGGFFICMNLPIKADLALLKQSAQDYQVLWTPMSFFSLNELGSHQIRLSCSFVTHEQIKEGVKRLAQFLRTRCRPTGRQVGARNPSEALVSS